jgi:hypothetical protein
MTQDVYMSRTAGSGATAAQLQRMFGVSSGSDPDPDASTQNLAAGVGPVGLEPTTQGLKVPCSTD